MGGTVCPVIPTPVGTGVLIAGGNFNSTDHNWIFDNWRYGTMQFWVPAPLRDEMDPAKLYDTSHHNHTTHNQMGIKPNGDVAHNGADHWWDDEGEGNCWQDNTYSRGEQTDNFTLPPPSCADGGSLFSPGAPVKDAGFLSCSQYDRNDPTLRHPPGVRVVRQPQPSGAGHRRAVRDGDPGLRQPDGRTAARAHRTGPAGRAGPPGSRPACCVGSSSPSPCCSCLVAGGGVAVARSAPDLIGQRPVAVRGTEATGVFQVADRTIRQVRYDDGGTLRYTFRLTNEGRLPVTVLGLSDDQPEPRLFGLAGLARADGGLHPDRARRVGAGHPRR